MNIDELTDDVAPQSATTMTPNQAKEIMERVEEEIAAFDTYFSTPLERGGCGNGPLVPSERALLKTYALAREIRRFPSVLENPRTSSK